MKVFSKLDIAIRLAVEAHAGQVDKGGNPYILHPLKVMYWTKSDNECVKCAAVLHDAVEDNKDFTWERLLKEGMSERTVMCIVALTKMPGETYAQYKAKVKANPDAVLVKMADLRHNSDIRRLKGVTERDIARAAKYHEFYLEFQQL